LKTATQYFFRFLLFGNVFVSLCAASLTYINALYFELIEIAFPLSIFIFCCTNIAYNFQRLFRIRKTSSERNSIRLTWIKENKFLLLLSNYLLSGIASFLLLFLPKTTFLFLIPIGLISLWYVVSFKKIPALRTIPFVKLFVIGSIWGLSTFGLPLFLSQAVSCSLNQLLTFAAISFFIIFQTIPFDIRDINYDNNFRIKTLAQYLGLQKSKYFSILGFGLLSLLFFWLGHQEPKYLASTILFTYSVSSLLAIPFIMGINAKSNEVYYSGGVESILLFPFLVYLFWMNLI